MVVTQSTKGTSATSAAEELGRLVGHGADEQAAGRGAPAGQRARRGRCPASSRWRAQAMKSRERVGLVLHPPVLVPGPAHLAAAAHVGDGEDDAAVEEREAVGEKDGSMEIS